MNHAKFEVYESSYPKDASADQRVPTTIVYEATQWRWRPVAATGDRMLWRVVPPAERFARRKTVAEIAQDADTHGGIVY